MQGKMFFIADENNGRKHQNMYTMINSFITHTTYSGIVSYFTSISYKRSLMESRNMVGIGIVGLKR